MSEPARNSLATRQAAEVVQADAASLMQIISRASADPKTDMDKLERLLSMYERISARDSERAFNEAMKAAQEEMPVVVRNAKNDQTNSRYATLDAVAEKMDPVIHRHGFSLSFGTSDSALPNHYRVTCTASHEAGHSREYFADVPSDMLGMKGNQNKTATHAFGSTMSYGRRYLKLLVFDVTLKDRDDDGNRAGNTPISPEQVRTLEALVTASGADRTAFLKYLGVEAMEDVPAGKFKTALAGLNAKKRAAAKAEAGQ
jgi:hypothetical protein